jgi:PilZ domain
MLNPQVNDWKTSSSIDFITNVVLTLPDQDVVISGRTENLSISGLFMQPLLLENSFTIGEPCTIKIMLHGERSNLIIDDLGGKIVSCYEQCVGVRFNERLEWYALFHIFEKKVNRMQA